jgi:hypothetical protein
MATYSGITVSNAGSVAVSIKSATGGTNEVSLLAPASHKFIYVSIDDANDIITGIKADGSEYIYAKDAVLTIALTS